MNLLLCFSGQIGSGKSSVSTAIAAALGWRRTGFGDYLRKELARLGGDPNSREALQDLGKNRVDDDPVRFCRDVLDDGGFQPGDSFVIDGVRHVNIFDHLTKLSAPSQAKLLYLEAPEIARVARIGARADAQDFARAASHPVETELRDALRQRADAVIDAAHPFEKVVADCLERVRGWRTPASGTV